MATTITTTDDLPRTKFLLRGKEGVELLLGPVSNAAEEDTPTDSTFGQPAADLCEFSRDGKIVVLASRATGFVVRDSDSGSTFFQVGHEGIQALAISPLASHIVTWERYDKTLNQGNLIVWSIATGAIVQRFIQKTYSKQFWPPVQWTHDESLCARMTPNQVHIYNGVDLHAGVISKIHQPNVASISVAPGPAPYRIATFVPEKSGRPANTRIFEFPQVEKAVASKSFYKAQEVKMNWSPNGSALIIETSTDVDTSGKSYYGETGLYFLQSDGEYDCIIPLTKEGPIQDVSWDPSGQGFIVLAGAMPCNATLYDNRARPEFEFGCAPRNTICWSPHGRFVCIAGFGNLRGDMDFWDRNKLKKMGSTNSNSATTYSWSPDGRYFSTATTFPRLRVDNGFKIFRYNGEGPIIEQSRVELYDMKWRPAAPGVYPNRPQSPTRANGDSQVPTRAPESKPQAYRPPRATGNLAAMMKREDGGSRKLDRNAYAPRPAGQRRIPGMAPDPEPKKTKSKKKNVKTDAAAAQEAIKKATAAARGQTETPPPPPQPVELTAEEKQKKIKGLNKKLKQINQLKEKMQGGAELNADQTAKIESEKEILAEIEKLS